MNKSTIKIILFIAALGTHGHAAASGAGHHPRAAQPIIVKVAVDARENAIVITGRNFGDALPTVRLADQLLNVTRFTENQVVAMLPPGVEPATYGLTVTTANGRSSITSGVFSAVLPGTVHTIKHATP